MSDGGRFIIVGASGLIGRQLTHTIQAAGHHVIPLFRTHAVVDGIQFNMLRQRLLDVVPDLDEDDSVVLLASHSDQAWISNNSAEAHELNVEASTKLALAVAERGAHQIFMSSESVFGQDTEVGWSEKSTPNPTTEYGRQKLSMEKVMLGLPNAGVVRTGWNVGWDCETRCVIKMSYQALLRSDAKMATDNILTLTDVADTARGIYALMLHGLTGVWHLAGGPIRRSDLADAITAASQFGTLMRYAKVKFSSLSFVEPRAAQAWQNSSESLRQLGLSFRDSRDIIKEKVHLLDQCQQAP
jgi:dTDP-4-dehydrorhamnose reductase